MIKSDFKQMIQSHEVVLVYFSGNSCSVCHALQPKIKFLLRQFPKIKYIEIEVENHVETAAQYQIFTVPAILLYIDGKEAIRELRHISVHQLENKISRYYYLLN